MFKSTWKCHAVFIINHGGSHWCKELPLKELLLPRTCAFMNIASSQRRENTTGLQYAGHWTSRKTLRNHSRLYLSLLWVFSKPENHPGYILCSCAHHVTSSLWKRYCVQKWSKSDWRFQRYWHFCITPLPKIFSYSDHYQLICLRHGFRSNTTMTYHPVCPGHCGCYYQCADS